MITRDNSKVMKFLKKTLLSIIAIVVFAGFSGTYSVFAVSLADQRLELVRSNCVSIKNKLNQLHASDALLRVNMGQIYESMLTKLMVRFNNRISSNHLSNDSLVKASNSYSQALDGFRADYKTYEEHLSVVLSIDCKTQPSQFYESIQTTKSLRQKVHEDVTSINKYTDQYQLALEKFEKDYQKISTGVNE